jgi:hypothetical protein
MLDTFASVGAVRFDVTLTTRDGEKDWYRRGVTIGELTRTLPGTLDAASICSRNVIVRPHGPGVTFTQLDDLKADNLTRIAPAVFLILETSPGNYQAWVAMPGAEDKDFTRRLRKGTGADPTASGATRVAGSLNFKEKYDPERTGKPWPRVTIHQANRKRLTTRAELERLGLVAEPETLPPLRVTPARVSSGGRKWPSYAICLDGAPLNSEETGPDTSRADIVFCMTAITWGFTPGETAARLLEEPESKAFARGKKYADDTARKAALYVGRKAHLRKSAR